MNPTQVYKQSTVDSLQTTKAASHSRWGSYLWMTSLALAALLLRMEARSLERPQSLGAAASHDGCTVRPQN